MILPKKSLRVQLTAWSLATTAVILLTVSLLAHSLVQATLLRETDAALRTAAVRTLHHMAPIDTPDADEPRNACDPPVVVRDADHATVTVPGIGTDALDLRLIHVESGRTAAICANVQENSRIKASLEALPAQASAPRFSGDTDLDQVRGLTTTVPQQPYLLQVALPWNPMEDLLLRLTIGLTLASLLFLLLSGVGSYLLVGYALRPMGRIVSEAEALSLNALPPAQLQAVTSDNEIGFLVAALNRMLTRLSDSFAAQRRFTADASHELRTPLTILRGEFELALARERSPAEYREIVASGLEEVLRLSRLAENLSLLARGDSRPSPLPCPIALRALLRDAVAAMEPRAQAQRVALVLDTPDEVWLPGEEDALIRMARNLLENAVTYTPPGGKVTVSLHAHPGFCTLCVADTGVGIASDDLPRIFERFYRADKARANTGGTGLGLSIVQSIVAAHGGQVTVESTPGEGSRFTVTLKQALVHEPASFGPGLSRPG